MAMRQEDTYLNQALQIVPHLSPEERKVLRQQLDDKTWGERWDELSNTIRARFIADGTLIPTDDEILADVKAVRKEQKDRLAQGSN